MRTWATWSVFLMAMVYLCLTFKTVSAGKCQGEWFRHSCLAGNSGKRSDSHIENRSKSEDYLKKLLSLLKTEIEMKSLPSSPVPEQEEADERPSRDYNTDKTISEPLQALWEKFLMRTREQEDMTRRK